MLRVEIANTLLVNMGKEYVILLRGTGDERTLPISIGQLEAQSIAMHLNQVPFPRPLTHDLFKSALSGLGCKLLRAEICSLIDETFYARLVIESQGKKVELDSRPSDAIAMAIRFAAPIYVEEKVMDDAGIIIPEENKIDDPATPAKEAVMKEEAEESLNPLESLERLLQKAIQEERYEDAARLRDEIHKMVQTH